MAFKEYTLLIATGQSPQVVTETVWSLARQHQPPMQPVSVEIVTTSLGAAYIKAWLLGEPRIDPVRQHPIPDPVDRWTPFCRDVLAREDPVPIHLHVPGGVDNGLLDVGSKRDDLSFANLCYRLVARLTEEGAPPLIGSIAGGRKTMSAHLMTAFCVYARPQDRLMHVLTVPDPLPTPLNRTFFYPTEEHAGKVMIRPVMDIDFPRLRGLLRQMKQALPRDGEDLKSLLDALEPHVVREETPSEFILQLGDRKARLVAIDGSGGELAVSEMTPVEAAIFLVVADALLAHPEGVAPQDLFTAQSVYKHPVHVKRELLEGYCNVLDDRKEWETAEDVSKALSRVRRKLEDTPLLARYLAFDSTGRGRDLRYVWPEPLPCPLTVTSEVGVDKWPLNFIVLKA